MRDAILEAIANNSIFDLDEITRAYDAFNSYDLLVEACELAQVTGYANLEAACLMVKARKD